MSPLQTDYDKWIKMSERLREEDVTRNDQLKDIAECMKHVVPEPPVQKFQTHVQITLSSVPVKRRIVESLPSGVPDRTPRNKISKFMRRMS